MDPKLGPLMMSIAVGATFVLLWGAVRIWQKGDRQKGVLMILAALVLLGNLLIWTL